MTRAPIDLTVVGDALLDVDVAGTVDRVCPDAPVPVFDEVGSRSRPGGAALAAVVAAHLGARVTLVTALGDDPAGAAVHRLLQRAGVAVVDLGLAGATPQKVRLRCDGHSLVRLDRGRPSPTLDRDRDLDRAVEAVDGAAGVLVADYGRGVATLDPIRSVVAATGAPVVWDPHPRGPAPVPGTTVATPSRAELEAATSAPTAAPGLAGTTDRAAALARRWQVGAIAVTCGADGVVLARPDGAPLVVRARPIDAVDPCGAGDAFSASLAVRLAGGHVLSEAVQLATATATAFVEDGGAAAVALEADDDEVGSASSPWASPPATATGAAPTTRPTVVATGGCFDLLHAGHVALLQAAAGLGDRLVVLLNSDHSVARLKGPDRPLQGEADRRALLLALGCVDEVVVFDDDTPVTALERLRPDVFVKGEDYAGVDLPEAPVLRSWGGRVVLVPYLDGRSTTRIVQEARRAG